MPQPIAWLMLPIFKNDSGAASRCLTVTNLIGIVKTGGCVQRLGGLGDFLHGSGRGLWRFRKVVAQRRTASMSPTHRHHRQHRHFWFYESPANQCTRHPKQIPPTIGECEPVAEPLDGCALRLRWDLPIRGAGRPSISPKKPTR